VVDGFQAGSPHDVAYRNGEYEYEYDYEYDADGKTGERIARK